jgi:hypothetical protein
VLKKLRALFRLRAWFRDAQLQGGGLIVLLGAFQIWLGTDDGMGVIEWIAALINLMASTLNGVAMMLTGLVLMLLRAWTEWSLAEKAAGVDQDPAAVASVEAVVNAATNK